jgi:putative pyruvate formate lyase activating enzyme
LNKYKPSYLKLKESGEFRRRVEISSSRLSNCNICPHNCSVNRLDDELGICRTGKNAVISSFGPHLGEENPIRGRYGSGTIFFSRCNLSCQFCQNYDISQRTSGEAIDPKDLAIIMLQLQERGCHNINLVSPSHVIPQILAAVYIAANAGLAVPLVYNSGGYDSIDTLKMLDGIVDIYMPDMKYADKDIAERFSKIIDYPDINQAAIKEMHKQVGDLDCDHQNIAYRGLLVRHLILPNNLAGTRKILEFLVREVSQDTYINLMDQYRPAFRASQYPELNRRITQEEYNDSIEIANELGLHRLDERKSSFFLF